MPARDNTYLPIVMVVLILFSNSCGQNGSTREVGSSNYSGPMSNFSVKGKVLEAKTWVDAGDSNVLVISEIQRGETYQKGYVSSVFGSRFTKTSGKWTRLWEIQEINKSFAEIVNYQEASLRIIDVDGDGMAESLFFYTVGSESGADPISLKMMFHWNGMKSPIRGKIPWTSDDIDAYEMTLDPKLKAAPDVVREFAIQEWKREVKTRYKGIVDNP